MTIAFAGVAPRKSHAADVEGYLRLAERVGLVRTVRRNGQRVVVWQSPTRPLKPAC